MSISTDDLRQSIATAAALAQAWFEEHAALKSRAQFDARGQLGDRGTGAVYVYFSELNEALYVGQTGRAVKARLHDQTSPHKHKPWWTHWTSMRFVALECDVDRLMLESLLIASYQPSANEKPRAKSIKELFAPTINVPLAAP